MVVVMIVLLLLRLWLLLLPQVLLQWLLQWLLLLLQVLASADGFVELVGGDPCGSRRHEAGVLTSTQLERVEGLHREEPVHCAQRVVLQPQAVRRLQHSCDALGVLAGACGDHVAVEAA